MHNSQVLVTTFPAFVAQRVVVVWTMPQTCTCPPRFPWFDLEGRSVFALPLWGHSTTRCLLFPQLKQAPVPARHSPPWSLSHSLHFGLPTIGGDCRSNSLRGPCCWSNCICGFCRWSNYLLGDCCWDREEFMLNLLLLLEPCWFVGPPGVSTVGIVDDSSYLDSFGIIQWCMGRHMSLNVPI